jgi:SNF2 family DNA or RNA helicase
MIVEGALLRKSIPVFRIAVPEQSFLARAWGGVYDNGTWLFPAYFPFAKWAFEDLRKLAPQAVWDDAALGHLAAVRAADKAWEAAVTAWNHHEPVPLPVNDDFFAPNFTPYSHQRLGIARLVYWWRSFLDWDMGTGKTRTVIDALRILRFQKNFRKALVLGPPVVLESWVREVARCSNGTWTAVIWDGTPEAEVAAQTADIVLVSYTRARMEREAAKNAVRELAITPAQRERYKLAPLTQEDIARFTRLAAHPLYALDYDTIIADESHYLGNWTSGQTQAAIELSAKAVRRYCLSGTPGDDPRKLYGQLYFLSPALIPLSYHKFVERHVVYSRKNKHIVVGFRFLNELNERFRNVALRMKKADCLDLPPVTTVDLYYDLGVAQRARYNELVMEMAMSVTPELIYAEPARVTEEVTAQRQSVRLPHGATRVTKLLQVLSGFVIQGADYAICDACPRMEACVEAKIRPYTKKCEVVQSAPERCVLRDIENPKLDLYKEQLFLILNTDETNKVIVWANYLEELDDLETATKALGVDYVRVDGQTLSRQKRIDRFQNDTKCRVYIGQIRTGIGVTLTAANYTIFYSLPWDPLQYRQAMDRNNRPGQRRAMTVYRLLTSDATWGLDRYVAQVLTFKENITLTLTDLVACAGCDQQMTCARNKILPFRKGCKYAANVSRPIANVEAIEHASNS